MLRVVCLFRFVIMSRSLDGGMRSPPPLQTHSIGGSTVGYASVIMLMNRGILLRRSIHAYRAYITPSIYSVQPCSSKYSVYITHLIWPYLMWPLKWVCYDRSQPRRSGSLYSAWSTLPWLWPITAARTQFRWNEIKWDEMSDRGVPMAVFPTIRRVSIKSRNHWQFKLPPRHIAAPPGEYYQ